MSYFSSSFSAAAALVCRLARPALYYYVHPFSITHRKNGQSSADFSLNITGLQLFLCQTGALGAFCQLFKWNFEKSVEC